MFSLVRVILLSSLFFAAIPLIAGDSPDFNHEIRPILSDNCFKCHGPDETKRDGGVRFDLRESATAKADSDATPIVPKHPEQSEIIRRINSTDPGEQMPPPTSNKKLTAEQKKLLERWIAEGAQYDAHWAFIAPQKSEPPKVKNADWIKNPIDNFILAKLDEKKMTVSPSADRYTLVRRVFLDLIGIPPTPKEADEFVDDKSPDAYEKLVDRLLASPQYGERWARQWLDLARYADTNGFAEDKARSIWLYRDWVINALNNDMSFDQFTIEQIAGDMLPNATLEQRVAAGFHRNTLLNEEAGIDPLEYRFYSMIDRVNTTSTVWLGLTLGCAQCHTHKYDPIPQRDYYHFFALMNNTEDVELEVPEQRRAAERAELEKKIGELKKSRTKKFSNELQTKFDQWRAGSAKKAVRWTNLRPKKATSTMPILTIQNDDSIFAQGDQTNHDTYTIDYENKLKKITAIRLEAIPDDRLMRGGPGRVYYDSTYGDFCLSELTVNVGKKAVPIKRAIVNYLETKVRKGTLNGPTGIRFTIDGKPETVWSVADRIGIESTAFFEFETPLENIDSLQVNMLFEAAFAAGLGRFRISATDEQLPEAINQMPVEIENLIATDDAKLTTGERSKLIEYFLSTTPELAKENKQIATLKSKIPEFAKTLTLTERPKEHTRITYLHKRGEFLQPGDSMEPNTLSILPAMPDGTLKNRLTLAKWLVDPKNPLPARVAVNRSWAALFGRGIVASVDDFGYQSDPPTHPELLDWLAVNFVENGWSMKKLHRLIVTSATYQQSSKFRKDLAEKDPQNKLLGRSPRYRLQAEQIRDTMLQASGLLSKKIGGPSVFPPQPDGATIGTSYHKIEWKVSEGEDRYRRGLYTYAKRTSPFAMFNAFDAPNGTVCTAKREISNSPLQALVLLNDPVAFEASQALGVETAKQHGTVKDRIETLFRRCVTRPASKDELEAAVKFYNKQLDRVSKGGLSPEKLVKAVDSKLGKALLDETAAWTLVARALLNLDEAITKE